MAQKADLILYVVDSSVPLDENDEEIMEMLTGKKAIILYNKTDLQPEIQPEILKEKTGHPVIPISAKKKKALQNWKNRLKICFLEERFPLMMRYILQMPVIKQHWKRLTEALIWSETVSKGECRKISFL